MAGQPLPYQLTELKLEDSIAIPSLNIAIAKAKTRSTDDKALTRISWYDTKLLTQRLGSDYFLLTSSQWDKARGYIQRNYPELESDLIIHGKEWVDSLLAFPNEDGIYSPELQIPSIKKGKNPLLIEKAQITKSGEKYIIIDGKVTEVPGLPLEMGNNFTYGYIQGWDDDLGLPTKIGELPCPEFGSAYLWVNKSYDYYNGLRALYRGQVHRSSVYTGRFDMEIWWAPSVDFKWDLGFRLGRHLL